MPTRKPYKDPRPARVAHLADKLGGAGSLPATVDLAAVGYVGAWRIQKGAHRQGVRASIFYTYSPHTPPHDRTIAWACSLPAFSGTHAETVDYLRSHWLDDARAFLDEVNK